MSGRWDGLSARWSLSPLSFFLTYPLLARWLQLHYPLCEIPPPKSGIRARELDGRGSGKKYALDYITSLPNYLATHILPLTDCSYILCTSKAH